MKTEPRPRTGILVLLAYLVVFYAVWIVTGVEYDNVGDSASTLLKWYVLPLAAGAIVLIVAATRLGWWRPALFEVKPSAPRWALVPAVLMAVVAVVVMSAKDYSDTTAAMVVLALIGSVGVGFGEELATRGLLLVGLRGRLTEPRVWFFSSLLFGLLHLPNWVFGVGPTAAVQVFLAFMGGTTFYLLRRASGTLIWAMALHGLWDFSAFVGEDAPTWSGLTPIVLGILSLVLVGLVLRRDRGVMTPQLGHDPGAHTIEGAPITPRS